MSETPRILSPREIAIRARVEAITEALDAADVDLGDYYAAVAMLRIAAEMFAGIGRPDAEAIGDFKSQLHRLARQTEVQP